MKEVTMEIPGGSYALLNKPNSKGEMCIYLRYFIKGKYVKRSTDIWIQPEDWYAETQTVKASNPNAARTNNRLNNLKTSLDGNLHPGSLTGCPHRRNHRLWRPGRRHCQHRHPHRCIHRPERLRRTVRFRRERL